VAEHDIYETFQQFMKQEANRGLGDIPLRSTAALAPISMAQMDAATNLLHKALRALDDGDEDRARRFVERAVALPYDEHERMHPAAMMAQQQLFSAVTDALDNGGDEWLDAAAGTFVTAPEQGRFTLRDVLKEVRQDYQLSDREERRLRRITQDVPERAELPDLELAPEQLAPAVLQVLESVIQFVDGYEEVIAFTRRDE
jgi:hypothetical protein